MIEIDKDYKVSELKRGAIAAKIAVLVAMLAKCYYFVCSATGNVTPVISLHRFKNFSCKCTSSASGLYPDCFL